ncbi:MAG: trypsin-like peptidase domain-containing protein [Burkholderiales bacterium]
MERPTTCRRSIRETLSITVTRGIASAIRTDPASGRRFIQSDTAISLGNSGGPLFDTEGNIVGIAVARYASGGATGLGLFIPIEDAINALNLKLTQ